MAVKTFPAFYNHAVALRNTMAILENFWLENSTKVVQHHNAFDFSSAADSGVSWVQLDSAGNIQGLTFTPQDYLNGINLYMQLENFFTNASVAQGTYRDVLSVITNPQ